MIIDHNAERIHFDVFNVHLRVFLIQIGSSSRSVLFGRNLVVHSLHYISQDDVLGCFDPGSIVRLRAHTSPLR